MSHASLSGVQVKIDRAKSHLYDLDDRCSPIIAACRNSITRECDKQRREYIFRLDKAPVIPPILGAIAGDAIHNLRVSLDYLMWQLVIASGGTPSESTSFPVLKIAPTPDRYGRGLPNTNPRVPRDMRKALDEVQPYKRSKPADHDLATLDGLDKCDKHRELLIAIIGLQYPALGWWAGGGVELLSFNAGPYNDGSEVCRFSYSTANGESDFYPSISFAVRIDEPAAGPLGDVLGVGDLIRRPLSYIENEVLPRFRRFF